MKSLKVPPHALRAGPLPNKWLPQKLFSDDDKDGVPNVFDCQPHNSRKQDKEEKTWETSEEADKRWSKLSPLKKRMAEEGMTEY